MNTLLPDMLSRCDSTEIQLHGLDIFMLTGTDFCKISTYYENDFFMLLYLWLKVLVGYSMTIYYLPFTGIGRTTFSPSLLLFDLVYKNTECNSV